MRFVQTISSNFPKPNIRLLGLIFHKEEADTLFFEWLCLCSFLFPHAYFFFTPIASANLLPLNLFTIPLFILSSMSSYLLPCSVYLKYPSSNLLYNSSFQPISSSSSQMTILTREPQNRAIFTYLLDKKWTQENIKQLIPKQTTRTHEIQYILDRGFSVTDLRKLCSQNPRSPVHTCQVLKQLLELKWSTKKEKCPFIVPSSKERSSLHCAAIWMKMKSADFQFGWKQFLIPFVSFPLFEGPWCFQCHLNITGLCCN